MKRLLIDMLLLFWGLFDLLFCLNTIDSRILLQVIFFSKRGCFLFLMVFSGFTLYNKSEFV